MPEAATSSELALGSIPPAVAPTVTATAEGATTGGAASEAAEEASDEAEVPWYRSPQMEGEDFNRFLEVSLSILAS